MINLQIKLKKKNRSKFGRQMYLYLPPKQCPEKVVAKNYTVNGKYFLIHYDKCFTRT